MSVARIVSFGPSCDTSEGRYQVVELSDKKYALAIGHIRLIRGLPLPVQFTSSRAWRNCNGRGTVAKPRSNQAGITSRPTSCARGPRGLTLPQPSHCKTSEQPISVRNGQPAGEGRRVTERRALQKTRTHHSRC
jgi:hypothetical protein